ncbi:MAG TPA: glycosyltransferase [Polyangiales bacterium]|nr:glycosyltransferase [Polyangiales bacterium]
MLHVIAGLNTGGAERMLSKVIAGSRGTEFEHKVLVLGPVGPLADDIRASGSEVVALNLQRKSLNLDSATRVLRTIKAMAPVAVQGWMYHGNLAALLGASLGRTQSTVLWNIRSGWQRLESSHLLTRSIMRGSAVISGLADAIIYNSRRARGEHEARGYASRAGLVIPNGFNTEGFVPSREHYETLRSKLGLSASTPIIGIIARNDATKDYTTFFRAVCIAAARNRDIHWVVVGRGIDAQSKEVIDAGASGYMERVSFMGERREIEQLAPAFDVATLSSNVEGFPNVVGEAMACGVPCVVTDAGDSGFVVGDTGTVVPIADPGALADGWLETIEMSASDRLARGAAARKRIIENFEISRISEQYANLYRSLLRR